MRNRVYRYNTLTCQYERVRTNARSVIWYCLGVMVMGSCMLLGILLLHDVIVNTENESRLRKENRAFRRHHAVLSAQLNELQPVLTSLQNKDRILHAKFFGAPPVSPGPEIDRASKQKLLLADARSFPVQVSALKATAERLIRRSARSNFHFASKLKGVDEALPAISSLPTLPPILPWEADQLISGFGLRVNPFHKGLYEHLGVDIAMPRGTPVHAPGSGVVKKIKRSDLQAGYGNYLELDHGGGLITRHAHLEDISVRLGERIEKGHVIATVGTSGGSVAPHLHYEILLDGKNMDPAFYMIEGLSSEEHDRLVLQSHQQNQSLD